MRAGEQLLHFQHLDERIHHLEVELHDLTERTASDREVELAETELAPAKERLQEANLRLRDMDREVAGHRERTRAREAELMSGRVRNPSELMQMSQEVEHAKAMVRDEEDRELALMAAVEEAETEVAQLTARLESVRAAWEAGLPAVRQRMERARGELEAAERERDEAWAEVPADYQAAYKRLKPRIPNPVAEVAGGQCGACRVGLTAAELQQVRRGEQLLHCQNCNRILVLV
ncbi:MAG TPA: C4-type zinc ribbon domain-containing protein [Candidatus Dormibacteraeota bacterium]